MPGKVELTLTAEQAEAANIPREIHDDNVVTCALRALGEVEKLNSAITKHCDTGPESFTAEARITYQRKRIGLFLSQFRASCVATELARESGIHLIGPIPEEVADN